MKTLFKLLALGATAFGAYKLYERYVEDTEEIKIPQLTTLGNDDIGTVKVRKDDGWVIVDSDENKQVYQSGNDSTLEIGTVTDINVIETVFAEELHPVEQYFSFRDVVSSSKLYSRDDAPLSYGFMEGEKECEEEIHSDNEYLFTRMVFTSNGETGKIRYAKVVSFDSNFADEVIARIKPDMVEELDFSVCKFEMCNCGEDCVCGKEYDDDATDKSCKCNCTNDVAEKEVIAVEESTEKVVENTVEETAETELTEKTPKNTSSRKRKTAIKE